MQIKNSISINSNQVFSVSNSLDEIEPLEPLNSVFSDIYKDAYIDSSTGATMKITLGSINDGLRIESISTTYSFAPGISSDSALSKLQNNINISDSYNDTNADKSSDNSNSTSSSSNKVEITIKPVGDSSSNGSSNEVSMDLSPSKVSYVGSSGDVFDSTKPNPSKNQVYEWIDKYSIKYGLDPSLIRGIVKAESNFNNQVISRSGAVGLIQLMPVTAKEMGLVVNDTVDERWDPEKNIEAGIKYIAKYHKIITEHFGYENWNNTIAGYNAGPNRVIRDGGIPNIKETQNYVKKVNQYWNEYK